MEYNPIAINEVLAYSFQQQRRARPTRHRFFIELVNTLTSPELGTPAAAGLRHRDEQRQRAGPGRVPVRPRRTAGHALGRRLLGSRLHGRRPGEPSRPVPGPVAAGRDLLRPASPVHGDVGRFDDSRIRSRHSAGRRRATRCSSRCPRQCPGGSATLANLFLGNSAHGTAPEQPACAFVLHRRSATRRRRPPATETTPFASHLRAEHCVRPGRHTGTPARNRCLPPACVPPTAIGRRPARPIQQPALQTIPSLTARIRPRRSIYWVCLRRPANPFAPVSASNPMIVVDACGFPISSRGALARQRRTGTRTTTIIFSYQRLQPFRGGHAVPMPGVTGNGNRSALRLQRADRRADHRDHNTWASPGPGQQITGSGRYHTLGTTRLV